jgi:hypothetical protein
MRKKMCFHTNQNCLLFQPVLKAAVSCNTSLYDTITLKIKNIREGYSNTSAVYINTIYKYMGFGIM